MSSGVGVDPRGPRVAAALTSAVLALVVLTGSVWLLLAQAAVFAIGAVAGPQATPYGWLYRRLVRPRLGPPTELEHPAPLIFAQRIGLAVTGLGVVLAALGVSGAAVGAAALAFVAAFLNAAFGLCLGCELYPVIARLRSARGI
ncbi:MAG: DUF4395 domain-containing protein [Kineosporiaceae bacterium]|nr:DUF4395 domain-containing protein [Kineosporiaceae bacterium]